MLLNNKKKNLLRTLNLTKKHYLFKQINNSTLQLKNLLAAKYKYKNLSLQIDQNLSNNKKTFLLTYIISFSFSPKNTLLHITDVWGNLKFCYSAGSVGMIGKQKKNRVLVLSRFFNLLAKIKITSIKNQPIALHLRNVGYHKYFIIKRLKRYFFIQAIKSYETYSYNGCRSKKKLHRRQRLKKRKNG